MSFIEDVIKWAASRDDWEADAIRRIYENPLTEEDELEIFKLLKLRYGLQVKDAPEPAKLAEPTEEDKNTDKGRLHLQSVSDLANVNRLKDGTGLVFNSDGLTIIYGDNGSGKSGYGRVFKKACRARHAPAVIHPNLYNTTKQAGAAEAKFNLKREKGEEYSIDWQDGQKTNDELLEIAIFDKQCARVHATSETEADFVPYGQDIFVKLIKLYEKLAILIGNEEVKLPSLPDSLDELNSESPAGKWKAALNAKTSAEEIDRFTKLTTEEDTACKRVKKNVDERKKKDPKKLAAELDRKAARTNALTTSIKTLTANFSADNLATAKKLNGDANEAAKAAEAASKVSFADEPLTGIGSDTWRLLFQAAREYAEKVAYPKDKYSDTFNRMCVLCQQPLTPEAAMRMKRFDDFIKDTTTANAEKLTKQIEDKKAALGKLAFNLLPDDSEIVADLTEDGPELLEAARQALADAKKAKDGFVKALDEKTWPEGVVAVDCTKLIKQLEKRHTSLGERAEALRKDKPTKEQIEEESQLSDYEDRLLLGKHRDRLVEYVKGLAVKAKLQKCHNALDKAALTRQNKKLQKAHVTEKLHRALQSELKALSVHHIVPEFKPKGSDGRLLHRIVLKDLTMPKQGLGEVFSEGEESVVAIAAFLAELDMTEKFSVVVFDDPVSSLDHKWRAKVAERLAELAKSRQVIVFTHDLVFLFGLMDWMASKGMKDKCFVQAIEMRANETGLLVPEGGEPIETLTVKKRIKRLNQRAQNARTIHNTEGESENYREFIKSLYSLLRRTWERAVEEVLFGDVVVRFRDSINTQRLRDVATVITSEDCNVITGAMDKASEIVDAHDTAGAARGGVPLPDEIDEDVGALVDFVKDIRARQEAADAPQPAPT